MPKAGKQSSKNGGNRPLNARVSYLFQAATYLSRARQQASIAADGNKSAKPVTEEAPPANTSGGTKDSTPITSTSTTATPFQPTATPAFRGTTHHLITQLRAVSLKSQIRLSSDVKRSTCKRCDAVLMPGFTCSVTIENLSRRGRKPWADVEVLECAECGARKRFPVGAKRQKRKGKRGDDGDAKDEVAAGNDAVEVAVKPADAG